MLFIKLHNSADNKGNISRTANSADVCNVIQANICIPSNSSSFLILPHAYQFDRPDFRCFYVN